MITVVTGLAAFLVGLGKGGLGGMIGALITAMMALVLPPEKVIGLVLPLLMVGDVFAVAVHWGKWDRSLILQLVPGGILGVLLATSLLYRISGEGLRTALGLIVLLFVVYKLFEGRLLPQSDFQPRRYHGWLAGVVSGITSTLAHGGGPPVSIFLVIQSMQPQKFAATAALYLFILNWMKVPSYFFAGLFDWGLIRSDLWAIPLVPLGVWSGKWLVGRIGRTSFERLIVLLLGISGILLLLR
ncbi:MAG: sulfite exporter TauE/SafE family protein [Anaerolineales bacterium]|nr:MAG: sulfite exporter TauE/SafE family protein [Anaerolineales bacterium]